MGEAEAVYKVIPNMKLANSNVACQWVSIGLEEEQSSRFLKTQKHHIDADMPLVELDGHEGLWYQQRDMWSKYLRRPSIIKNICFAQFAKMFQGINKSSEEVKDTEDPEEIMDDVMVEDDSSTFNKFDYIMTFNNEGSDKVKLPPTIELKDPFPGESKIMKKRSHPVALRFHKVNQNNNAERYFFGEVMLYYPLDFELKLDEAYQLYEEKYHNGKRKVDLVKAQVMEYLEGVEETRYHLEMLEKELDLSSTGKDLDPQGEMDNDDCADLKEETSEYDQYEYLNPDDLSVITERESSRCYKKIIIPSNEELINSTRELDPYQRELINAVVKYSKDLVKSRKTQNKPPIHPLIMVHGGAGSGKSTVIKVAAQWAEKILVQEGQDVGCPCVVIGAFCGTAAANVGGNTLHSLFGFSFKNQHFSLNDKARDNKRSSLKYVKLIIIDEISMVPAVGIQVSRSCLH